MIKHSTTCQWRRQSGARWRRYLWLALLAPVCAFAELELIELRGRSAEELIPVLQPLLAPGTALSGSGHQLIVRGDAGAIAELRRLVSQLDAPLRNLLVEVRHVQHSVRDSQRVAADVHVGETSSLRLQAGRTSSSTRGEAAFQARTLEGRPVFVHSGTQRQMPVRETRVVNGRVVTISRQREVSADSGFYVTPRLSGEEVILDVTTSRQRFSGQGGSRESSAVSTQVRGPIGAWIGLGGVDSARSSEAAGLLSRRSLSATRGLITEVRVSVLTP